MMVSSMTFRDDSCVTQREAQNAPSVLFSHGATGNTEHFPPVPVFSVSLCGQLGEGTAFPYPGGTAPPSLPHKFTQNLKIYGTVGEMGAVGVTSTSDCSMPGSGSRKGLSLGTSITLTPGANCWMYS